MRSYSRGVVALAAGLAILVFACESSLTDGKAGFARPNMVIILVDDLRWDELGYTGHPFVKTPNIDRIAREGAYFRNAFTTTPLCSPSRASFLTGLYAHTHGIIDNTNRSAASHRLKTFPRCLHENGYETAFVGKWHMGNDDSRRPGFDYWVTFKGQGRTVNPELNDNGIARVVSGYVTDVLTDRAVAFIDRPHSRPFLVYVSHKALHPEVVQYDDGSVSDPTGSKFIPAERHKNLYASVTIPRRPNFARPPQDKPALWRPLPGLSPLGHKTATPDEVVRARLRMLAAVDESTGRILRTLEKARQLDDTIVVFTSDHGYFYGEHGLSVERRLAYEETLRIPLFLRYPPLVRPGSTFDDLVLSIDLAPTLLEIGQTTGSWTHGRSLVPLLKGKATDWRTSFLIEYYSDKVWPRVANMGYQAVRTKRFKYIRYTELANTDELYDLDADPYEMNNLFRDSRSTDLRRKMDAELDRLLEGKSISRSP